MSICAALCVLALLSGGAAWGANETEPNDSYGAADAIVADGSRTDARLRTVFGDMDSFVFAATAGVEYIVQTSCRTGDGTDTCVDLVSSDGETVLATDEDSGNDQFSHLTRTPASSGTYCVRVYSWNRYTLGPYSLAVWPNSADTREPDDTMAQGSVKPLTIDGPAMVSVLTSRTDKDWTYFTPPPGTRTSSRPPRPQAPGTQTH